jgi:type I restriction enzyme S subunit
MMFGLKKETIEAIRKVLARYSEVEKAILYGSRAKGNYRPGSDIDLTLIGEKLNLSTLQKIENELDDLLLPYKIDLSLHKQIQNKDLLEHIERVGKVFFDRNPATTQNPKNTNHLSEWKKYKLKNAPLSIIDGDRGKNYPNQNEFQSYGYCLFLSTKNVRLTGFDFTDCQFITKEKDELLRKGKLIRNDLVLTTRGTVGNIGFYSDEVNYDNIRINSGMVIIRPHLDQLDPKFNFYVFRFLQKDFLTFTTGSAQPQLPIRDLKEIEIKLPSLPEQQAIAEVLSSLDDKIDLLHRQNKTLEALAETLFRQWFIEEADERWEVGKLGNLIVPKKGKNLTKSEAIAGNYPVVAGGLEPSCYHNQANTKAPVVTISASGANAGFVRIYYTPVWSSDSSYIDETITPFVYFSYIFLKVNQKQLIDKQEGSAQPHIYPSHIMELEMVKYPKILIEKFEKEVSDIFQKTKHNTQQIRTLTQLRDTLLPKLMSGEVRVSALLI